MFVARKQIKKNKIKRALQIIFFFFSYKSFCRVIVYEKKRKKRSHSMTVSVSKIKKKMSLRI
jgi:hypothetical protein